MTLQDDILRTLRKGTCTYEELKNSFPHSSLDKMLITMENQQLIINKEGIWSITKKGRKKTKKKIKIANIALIIPLIIFLLLSAHFYSDYSSMKAANTHLLQEIEEKEIELSALQTQKESAETELTAQQEAYRQEQNESAHTALEYQDMKASIIPLTEKKDYYACMEKCTPNAFVTVDNTSIKKKVDELTKGLTTSREKQKALFDFVRDNIKENESPFGFGRIDFWEYPEDILMREEGSYEDKYLLLLTMLRIAGTPPEHVRFVAADVNGNDNFMWVEVYDGDTWWILDPFQGYTYTDTPRDEFFEKYKVIILWWFNDTTFQEGAP